MENYCSGILLPCSPLQTKSNQQSLAHPPAHEVGHQLVNRLSASGKVVGGMGLDDTSLNTYNGGACSDPSVYTGVSADGKTPIHWGSNADASLTNILGKRN